MKTLIRITLIAAILVGFTLPAVAQTYATTTTLSAALAEGATSMAVTSNTGFTVGNWVYIDQEVVLIRSISGTTIGISRGQRGTLNQSHRSAERVVTGANDFFRDIDPDFGGVCSGTAAGGLSAAFLPWINVRAGRLWVCVGGVWRATTTMAVTYDSIPTTFP